LKVGVPWKTTFTELVSVENNGTNFTFGGFCVKVFEEAIKTLNYSVHYIPLGNGITEPSYDDDLLRKILFKEVDAVVGDVTIIAYRAHEVLFTQPFMDAGLLAVVPQVEDHISLGFDILKPFTAGMWVLILGFFITGSLTVYLLERRKNPQFEGHPSRQLRSIVWFTFSTWFTNHNGIKTVMGRIVLIAWLFVTGILYSCYTANLSAILTAPRLQPTLNDIHSVVASRVNIGFQNGSYAEKYLREYFRIDEQRLKPLNREAEYYKALFRGEVGAIIGERHYMQSLVAKHCNKLTFAGQMFTSQNWGFAFDPMHDQLVKEISIRILELSDEGTLHTIHKQSVPNYEKDCGGYTQLGSGQLGVYHFWDLFVVSGLVSFIVLLLYMVRWKWNASIIAAHSSSQDSSGRGGGLEFQFRARRTKSLNAISERGANI
jgi:ionotropic glutamate receptor